MATDTELMTNHWWWRPGWRHGRSFYTWHLTLSGMADVERLAAEYRSVLDPLDGLDLVPDRWLHLTMQGVGFVGEVPESTVNDILTAARPRLAALRPFDVTLTAPIVAPEALLVPVQPPGPVRQVRDAVRAAIGDVQDDVPETEDGFTPHVSLAYSNAQGPAAPFTAAIAAAAPAIEPATAHITHADLIRINRDHQMYEWTTVAQVPLG